MQRSRWNVQWGRGSVQRGRSSVQRSRWDEQRSRCVLHGDRRELRRHRSCFADRTLVWVERGNTGEIEPLPSSGLPGVEGAPVTRFSLVGRRFQQGAHLGSLGCLDHRGLVLAELGAGRDEDGAMPHLALALRVSPKRDTVARPEDRSYNEAMKRTAFPPGWDEERTRRVLEHYKKQTEDEAVAEETTT